MQNDRAYFLKREAEERSAAQRAEGKAREAHEELAEKYRQLSILVRPEAGLNQQQGPEPEKTA